MAKRAIFGPKCVVLLPVAVGLALASCSKPEPTAARSEPAPALAAQAAGQANAKDAPAETSPPVGHRIIKQASLEMGVASVADAQARVTRIAEQAGGFVANASRTQTDSERGPNAGAVTLTLRVPAERFSSVLGEIRKLGRGAASERVTTDDVSEEFVDLEARIHNLERREAQFGEIMKTATKVEEALHVQRELSNVRTEIDRMQGRRRFLERATALSTITIELRRAEPLVSATTSDFKIAVVRAYSDAIDVGAGIVTGAIRIFGVLLPFAVLVGLPLAFTLRAIILRKRRVLVAPSE